MVRIVVTKFVATCKRPDQKGGFVSGYYMSSLMDPQTNATLHTFSECLVDLYNKAGVSGETSLQDNYSDIFGLTIVVETFKREENRKMIQEALAKSPILYHFTPEELMFVTYGQVKNCFITKMSRLDRDILLLI